MDSSLKSPHLTEWNLHAGYGSWLRELLRAPEGRLLMLVLEEMSHPDIVDEDFEKMYPGTSLTEHLAFRHLLCSGQKMAHTNIRALAALPDDPATELSPEWSYGETELNK